LITIFEKIMKQIIIKFLMTSLLVLLASCSPNLASFKSIDLTGADYAKGFSLLDFNGKNKTLADFSGKVVVVFFGYTQCPDFCPTTLTEFTEVKQKLGSQGDRLQAIFITVDPERDQPDLLKEYMGNFDPTFLALIPTPEQLEVLAKDYKIYFKKVPVKNSKSYTMDHSAGTYIYDTSGRLRLYARYGLGPQSIAEDIGLLLKQ